MKRFPFSERQARQFLAERETADFYARFQEYLQKQKTDQEGRRDESVTLIAGGALAVSFAFVPFMMDHGTPVWTWALYLSWIAWALVLIAGLVGYTVAIRATDWAITQISRGIRDWEEIFPKSGKWIEPINIGAIVLLLLGFVSFGAFSLGNLTNANQEESRQEDNAQEVGQQEEVSIQGGEDRQERPSCSVSGYKQEEGLQEEDSQEGQEGIGRGRLGLSTGRDNNAGTAGQLAAAEEEEMSDKQRPVSETVKKGATLPQPPTNRPQSPQPTPKPPEKR